MGKLETIKTVGGYVVGYGVAQIVGFAISRVIPVDVGLIKKGCMWLGGCMLMSMASSKVTKFYEEEFDDTVGMVKEVIEEAEKMKSEVGCQ